LTLTVHISDIQRDVTRKKCRNGFLTNTLSLFATPNLPPK